MKASHVSILSAVLVGAASISVGGEIDVMTQNQYIGADLQIGATASTQQEADDAVVAMLSTIAKSRPAERVRNLAAEIGRRNPDVVGLQEAFEFKCLPDTEHGFPPMPGRGCDDPLIRDALTDHLQGTEEALRSKYVVAGKVTNLHVSPIFFGINNYRAILSITDRDAILVRKHLSESARVVKLQCSQPSDDGCNYESAPPPFTPQLGPPIALKRGFVAIDVTIQGREYRVFNTHLEQQELVPGQCVTQMYQVGQAYELLDRALSTWNRWDGLSKTVIVIGDINSGPKDIICSALLPTLPGKPALPALTPYQIFTSHGFTDAWALWTHQSHRDVGLGFTCCEDPDLLNPQPKLTERIDMIFSLQPPSQVRDMDLLGNTGPSSNGLWPSDHAALAGTLKFHSAMHPVHIERY
ncbi:MAG: hypothetical protein LV473_06705 [Nitrospira sp.]|nr:hypothetical protein [Nitrospira sp.]